MSMRKARARVRGRVPRRSPGSRARPRRRPRARRAGHARASRRLGHQHRARRRRPAAGLGHGDGGKAVYEAKCLACHGADGAGQPNDRLVGGQGTLRDAAPIRTIGSYWPYATTVFDYIRRAMPYVTPQSLTPDETYALTAYLLA